jgi:hypothetical protein
MFTRKRHLRFGFSPQSSLANYCLAESLFRRQQYQSSAYAFRVALQGDGAPTWTGVWSYIGLGKIFDVTSQRERALRQYQLAIDTGDNTRGALDETQQLLQRPYDLPVSVHSDLSNVNISLPDKLADKSANAQKQ